MIVVVNVFVVVVVGCWLLVVVVEYYYFLINIIVSSPLAVHIQKSYKFLLLFHDFLNTFAFYTGFITPVRAGPAF